ncbi:hypothetical protein RRSWK_01684 [Rhodopirellula sp. SWK7]|nr:hypothetical protein RRSWK_01684 [Rhodopirellula sp. SWK7]
MITDRSRFGVIRTGAHYRLLPIKHSNRSLLVKNCIENVYRNFTHAGLVSRTAT